MTKYVYFFGAGRAEGSSVMRNLLGGKGCELAEMTNLGIPVPPGFTITTQAWVHRQRAGRQWPEGLWEQILEHLARLEQVADARFGDGERPLLVSVRSGARVSMPGMMETILNLGLNDATVEGLAARTGNERFAWDCYRRFLTMFSSVVLGLRREIFDEHLDAAKARLGVTADAEVPAERAAQARPHATRRRSRRGPGQPFPQDVREQLRLAVDAVFDSWFAKKATEYRRIHGVPEEWGTAVTVMAMVFGNLGEASGTGVGFTRDPRTGEARFYAEFLPNAQGEDVVAGIRTPLPIEALQERMPAAYAELLEIATRLERHYKDMQDIEFTVQEGTLYLLQTRGGKRSARAAVRVAVDLEKEHVIDQHTAILRVKPPEVNEAIRPVFDDREQGGRGRGRPAPGARAGGRARRRGGPGRVRRGPGRGVGQERPAGDPGAPGDLARGRRRDVRGRGHRHLARRAHVARGGGGGGHGQGVRGRGRRPRDRRGPAPVRGRRPHRPRGRRGLGGRRDRRGDPGRDPDGRGAARATRSGSSSAGRTSTGRAASGVRANADTPADAERARGVRGRGHRAGADRAHVLRARPAARSSAR